MLSTYFVCLMSRLKIAKTLKSEGVHSVRKSPYKYMRKLVPLQEMFVSIFRGVNEC